MTQTVTQAADTTAFVGRKRSSALLVCSRPDSWCSWTSRSLTSRCRRSAPTCTPPEVAFSGSSPGMRWRLTFPRARRTTWGHPRPPDAFRYWASRLRDRERGMRHRSDGCGAGHRPHRARRRRRHPHASDQRNHPTAVVRAVGSPGSTRLASGCSASALSWSCAVH